MRQKTLSSMTDYTVKYVDKIGDYQEFKTIAKDVRQGLDCD